MRTMQIESFGAAASLNRLDVMLDTMENELAEINWKIGKETDMLISQEFSAIRKKIDFGTMSIRRLADLFRKAESCTAEHNPIEYE